MEVAEATPLPRKTLAKDTDMVNVKLDFS